MRSAASGSSTSAPSTARYRASSERAVLADVSCVAPFRRSSSPWQNQLMGSSPTALAAPFIVWTWRYESMAASTGSPGAASAWSIARSRSATSSWYCVRTRGSSGCGSRSGGGSGHTDGAALRPEARRSMASRTRGAASSKASVSPRRMRRSRRWSDAASAASPASPAEPLSAWSARRPSSGSSIRSNAGRWRSSSRMSSRVSSGSTPRVTSPCPPLRGRPRRVARRLRRGRGRAARAWGAARP